MKFAYADPPYIGQAHRYKEKEEVDHYKLIQLLYEEYPDGWALSASSPSLHTIIPLLHKTSRIMAWVKPFCIFKPGVGLAYAWEPVILEGGRKIPRTQPTIRDFVSCNITLKKGLVGAKPEGFCKWVLSCLNVKPGDELHDLFPGTGVMGRVFEEATKEEADGILQKSI